MAEAAWHELPYPETAIIEAETLEEQNLALAADLPERPLILGGCCCSHIGDLNTPESSPSGNLWGMPLRKLIDSGAIEAEDVALVGARNLDPPEEEYIRSHGVHLGEDGIAEALDGAAFTYVAFDVDVLDPDETAVFMPEPDGLSLAEAERILGEIANRTSVLGAGLTGSSFEPGNVGPLSRLAGALGL
jgi:arginase